MSTFLHSAAWERFQTRAGHVPVRHEGYLYLQHLAARFRYAGASRIAIGEGWTPPAFPTQPHFLRLEPVNEQSLQRLVDLARRTKRQLAPTASVQPRQTVLLDLAPTEHDLLAGMHQKHRYNIRLADRHGVTVSIYSANLADHFERFWKLLQATAERQGFRTHARSYYAAMVEELGKDGEAHLVFAQYGGQDLAAMLLITHGQTAVYLHGGSSAERKEMMAPYALHWAAIRFAKDRDCTVYDLWGSDAVRNPETGEWEPDAGHPSAGVTRLKLGFGGSVLEYPGTFDLVLSPFWYSSYKALRAVRARKRAFS